VHTNFLRFVESLNQVNIPSLLLLLASCARPSNACKGIVSQGWRDGRLYRHGPRHTRPGRTKLCNRQLGSGYAYAYVSPVPVFEKQLHTGLGGGTGGARRVGARSIFKLSLPARRSAPSPLPLPPPPSASPL